MVITNKKTTSDLTLPLRDKPIEKTENHKFFGIIIDDRLLFRKHIDELVPKLIIGKIRGCFRQN